MKDARTATVAEIREDAFQARHIILTAYVMGQATAEDTVEAILAAQAQEAKLVNYIAEHDAEQASEVSDDEIFLDLDAEDNDEPPCVDEDKRQWELEFAGIE